MDTAVPRAADGAAPAPGPIQRDRPRTAALVWTHRIEGLAARAALRLFRALGPVRASNLGGALARAIGPLLPVSRVADTNLRLTMPELDGPARARIIRGVWDNLGRTVGELPHVAALRETASGPGWEIDGDEHIRAVAAQGGPAILFTAHIGNWELLPLVAAERGAGFASIYRPSNNPAIDEIILGLRSEAPGAHAKHIPKGSQGAKQALQHLRSGGYLGLLPDQKMNDGIESRFFGLPAMTAPAPAALALRLRCPIVPGYSRRIGPARFRLTCNAPLPLPDTGDRTADVAQLTQAINDQIEAWIRAWPEGWLWLHRRWPRACYPGLPPSK